MKSKIQSLLALVLLMSCGFIYADGITIDDPYVRAIPPGQTISAAFMVLENGSDSDIALVKATSDIAMNVELHEHVEENGMMKMRQVPKINIAAKGKTNLKPGGYHIMLIDLKKGIKPGDLIDITLEFDNGSSQTITSQVKKIMMGMMKNKGGMKRPGMGHGMGKGMAGMQAKMKAMKAMNHANPMPNLMMVVTKMGEQLKLDKKQAAELKQWRDERGPVVNKLVKTITQLETEIQKAALENESLEKIDQLADSIMQNRIQLIRGKALCRENMKRILDDKQYKKVVELYKANFIN